MIDRRDVMRRMKEAGLRPRKGLGQHFLVDEAALRRIAQAAELTRDDVVVEIGAGPGTLTQVLAAEAGRVLAVEIDPNMVAILRAAVADCDNVRIVLGDILSLSMEDVLGQAQVGPDRPYKVVGNLPYYVTSAILRHVLEAERRPSCLVVTVQEEVARRIVARPGEMSLLAISVQLYGRPRITARIPAGAFRPPPKVDSAVVRVDLAEGPLAEVADVAWFFAVARAGFSSKRKQLHNALTRGLDLSADAVGEALTRAGVDPTRRAQTLTLEEWSRLSQALRSERNPR